jgi:methylenetetrahydrofolate dehydrogenase (NADP+) / methenyltetrahydrofolate cyclohydrolase / formyltetrahydrofolate synthetase
LEAGAEDAVMSNHWAEGGAGSVELGEAVIAACEKPSDFSFLYPLELSIKEKIEIIAKEMYGAAGVEFSEEAEQRIAHFNRVGFDKLPICMAKTHLEPEPRSQPQRRAHRLHRAVRDIRASVGAGFLYPLVGQMSTMPGLPTRPAFYDIDLDLETGKVIGLF